MSDAPIRVLLIEDNPGDARLIQELLVEARIQFDLTWSRSLSEGLDRLESASCFDAVLLDLMLPDSHGIDTFRRTHACAAALPIVVMSVLDDERLAVEAVHAGAQDYLVKGRVDGSLLARSLRYAIERKRSETALQESEARFRAVFEGGPVGMVLLDLEARVLSVNEAFCRMLGRCPSDLLGVHIADMTHPEDVAGLLHHESRLFAGEIPKLHLEQRYVPGNGQVLWGNLTASVVRDAAGRALYGIGIVENITDRKAAIQKMVNSEKLLSQAQKIAHLGSWEWNVASDQMSWSDELYRIFGLFPKELGATFEGYLGRVHPDDRDFVRDKIEAALRNHEPFDFQQRIVLRDGTIRILRSQGEAIIDSADKVLRMVGVCQDITEQKRVELELALARDAALQSAQLKSAFIANMSHEIRTPLNIILGYNTVLAEDFPTLDEQSRRSLIEGVERAGARLITTIDGLLDISKIETGNFDLRPVRLELRAVIEREVENCRVLAWEKDLWLSCEIQEPQAAVRFDDYCLSHALMNLLQNAIKFTEQGGVTVRLERDEEGSLSIHVRDTGIGIDKAYLPRLFEPFSQGETGYTRRFEGSGLGLTLTKEYLELNGACVSVESEIGKGSEFRIHFSRACEDVDRLPAPE